MKKIAKDNVTQSDLSELLDIASYFNLIGTHSPNNFDSIVDCLEKENIVKKSFCKLQITNLGGILLARDLMQFEGLRRKKVRVIQYKGSDRLNAIKEHEHKDGYASGFEKLVQYVNDRLPSNEVIHQALRETVQMYPPIAIRELIANALIHQDFYEQGTGPMIEIFQDRLEITNPGRPKINTLRFIDHPPQSRNEMLASIMRRMNMCEERGSGVDRIVSFIELFQLPPPDFTETENHTRVILFSQRPFAKMDRANKIRACYQHACLKYVSGQRMSNQTLRERFGISEKNYAISSRVITDTIEEGLIKPFDLKNKSKKFSTYIPFWV